MAPLKTPTPTTLLQVDFLDTRLKPTLVPKFSCTSEDLWTYHELHTLLLLENMGEIDPLLTGQRASMVSQMDAILRSLNLDDDCGVLGKGCSILDKFGYSGYGLYYGMHRDEASRLPL